jgi:hypothetical protein
VRVGSLGAIAALAMAGSIGAGVPDEAINGPRIDGVGTRRKRPRAPLTPNPEKQEAAEAKRRRKAAKRLRDKDAA